MKKPEPLLRPGLLRDIIIFQDADGTIHFKHRQSRIANASHPVLAQSAIQLVHGNVLFCHVRGNAFAIMDQKSRRSLNHLSETTV